MNRLVAISPRRAPMLSRHALALLVGFACTLPALANVSFPSTPLQTGSAVPPNVTLVLDDSGSMYWRYIYIHNADGTFPTIKDSRSGGSINSSAGGDETANDNFGGCDNCVVTGDTTSYNTNYNDSKYMVDQSYATNGLYYNPNVAYSAWHYPDGTVLPSTAYTAAYQDHNNATYSWTAVDGTTKINTTSATTNLSGYINTFYVPQTAAVDTSKAENYYRYQILKDGTIYRSSLGLVANVTTTTTKATDVFTLSNQGSAKNVMTQLANYAVANASSVVITISGGTNKAVLYERKGAAPSTGTNDNNKASPGTITLTNPADATYYIALYGNGVAVTGATITTTITYKPVTTIDPSKQVTGVGCNDTTAASTSYDWRFCTKMTPTGRTEADERANFANWYSFYETRIKTAKAGMTAAFSALTTIPRVGYRTIHDRSNIDIPVAKDDGLFEDKAATVSPAVAAVVNKTNWFKSAVTAAASSGTPLRTALDSVGTYYKSSATTGPYGPQAVADQLACRQNFTILTTDGYWNDSSSPVAGNQDNTNGTLYTADAKSAFFDIGDTSKYTAAAPYKDSSSSTLADVANYYWKTDLRTDLLNKVPVQDAKDAFWQHMVTFTISIGAKGTLDPATILGYIAAGTAFTWPAPTADKVTTIDDLFHAAINGHGTFTVATNPNAFVSALSDALSSINQITTSSSNLATTSALLTTGSQIFRTTFTVGLWTGDLAAFAIDPTTGISSTADWNAGAKLDALGFASRKLFTWNGTAGANFPTTAQTTTLTADVANYIKGDQSKEQSHTGGTFRNRDSILGDMIDSSPAFVPADTTVTPNTNAMLYVGGNDGFLHAFKASTGDEVFAYMPGGINLPNLKTLSDPKYVHQYFVDGSIVVSTKDQTKNTSDTTGKNILVGLLGRGGNTVYALDVTDPGAFGTGKVLWEYSNTELGNSLGTPVIAKLNKLDGNGDPITGVIIGNGYNSASGHSQVFILNIRTGALIAQLDSVAGDTTTNTNGMTTPKGWDADRSGTVDNIYAGDLLGNVWEFDVSDSDSTKWKTVYGSKASPQPLYTAKDKLGNRQPITGGLSIGLNPADFNRWVFFGTGRYLTSGDPADKSDQTWYGLIDPGPTGTAPYPTPISSVTTRDSTILKQRKIVAYGVSNGNVVRAFEQPTAGDMAGKKGWYLDLLGSIDQTTNPDTVSLTSENGERIVSDPTLLSNTLIVASILPSKDACDVGGTSFVNAIDAFTGANLSDAFFDSNGDGVINSSDVVGTSGAAGSIDLGVGLGGQAGFLVNDAQTGTVYQNGTSGASSLKAKNPTNSGRISWREIIIGN